MTPEKIKEAEIIEQFIGMGISMKELADINGVTFGDIQAIVGQHYPVSKGVNITIPSTATGPPENLVRKYWNTLDLDEIGVIIGLCRASVYNMGRRMQMPKKPRINRRKPNKLYAKMSIILNTETGIYYFSKHEAAASIGKLESYLAWYLSRAKINKTQFILLGKF